MHDVNDKKELKKVKILLCDNTALNIFSFFCYVISCMCVCMKNRCCYRKWLFQRSFKLHLSRLHRVYIPLYLYLVTLSQSSNLFMWSIYTYQKNIFTYINTYQAWWGKTFEYIMFHKHIHTTKNWRMGRNDKHMRFKYKVQSV